MRKLYSLIRACMTSDMKLFKIKTKKNSRFSMLLPLFIALYLMFMVWGGANSFFEKLAPMHFQYLLLSLFVFGISFMTIMEGIYKTGSLIFNCKDDQLLLSLPIKRRTVLFVRLFKFYVFELLFNSLFLLPIMIAYIRWAEGLSWTYFLTSFVMLIFLPIIPIVISCIIGFIVSSLSSKFKYKNAAQIVISMVFLVGILVFSYSSENIFNYLIKHASSMNDLIIKIYYPAGVYVKLVTEFNVLDLFVFIFINVVIFILFIFIFGKFYFKINSRLKSVATNKKVKSDKLVIKSHNKTISLIKKELNTFFKIPVFIINAGFALVLFILIAIIISFKFDSVVPMLTDPNGINMSFDLIMDNMSILIFVIISAASFMTSITSSVISLEGRNISILKSLPLSTKTILMSKVYSSLVLTTPVLLFGDLLLFIRFKIGIIEGILLIMLSILIPLVSHFIGIIVNLKFPKLNFESSSEVVKQSTSSFISVMLGMVLMITSVVIIGHIVGAVKAIIILLIATGIYLVIDILLYFYLIKKGVKDFDSLSL